jgi:hypothetical protein
MLYVAYEYILSARFLTGVAVGILIAVVLSVLFWRRRYRAAQVTLSIPFGLGNITYNAADQDRELAWKMYVQLKTRKAALPFDDEHDTISDVLDSLYEIFSVARDLLSDARPHHGQAHRSIADFILRVLNDGIRPNLTRWNSRYRKWWEPALAAESNKGKSPQELQRDFPQYEALVRDIKTMNSELSKYAEDLLLVVHAASGSKAALAAPPKRIPEPPVVEPSRTQKS